VRTEGSTCDQLLGYLLFSFVSRYRLVCAQKFAAVGLVIAVLISKHGWTIQILRVLDQKFLIQLKGDCRRIIGSDDRPTDGNTVEPGFDNLTNIFQMDAADRKRR